MLQIHARRSALGRNTSGCTLVLLFPTKRDKQQIREINKPLCNASIYFLIHLVFQSQRFIRFLDFGFSELAIFFNHKVGEKKFIF